MKPEIHLFVLWQNARQSEERILADMRENLDVLATVDSSWPVAVSAEQGFRRFYGTFLQDAAGKVRRVGSGNFLVVVVRDNAPVYEYVETARGIERVDVNIFHKKYEYRSWVGGQHRVHGTNSPEEAKRDVMLLTGIPLAEWVSGAAVGKPQTVLPGQSGWARLDEMFRFLNETIPYAVLRNGDSLPSQFDPLHDDIDLLVSDAKDCIGLLGARKIAGGGSLYAVQVGGQNVKLDIRSVGDGYYDTSWARDMLATRCPNNGGVQILSPRNLHYALLYHVLYHKHSVASDYPTKIAVSAKAMGMEKCEPDEWLVSLDAFMRENGYRFTTPRDKTVHVNSAVGKWRDEASAAAAIFGLADVHPVRPLERAFRARGLTDLILEGVVDGATRRIAYGRLIPAFGEGEFHAAAAFRSAAPNVSIEHLTWHVGQCGGYVVTAATPGESLASRLVYGAAISDSEADRWAADAIEIAKGLEAAGIVHRDICPENIWIAPDGLKLDGFRFALIRKTYRKEVTALRKRPLELLAKIGGDFALTPGCWNDCASLAKVLELLPQTDAVRAAIDTLRTKAGERNASLCVKLPLRIRIRLFRTWLAYAIQDVFRPNSRAAEKHRVKKRFAYTAAFRRPSGYVSSRAAVGGIYH